MMATDNPEANPRKLDWLAGVPTITSGFLDKVNRKYESPQKGKEKMKIFFDTEFMEDGRTIELISIGMVREDGAQYYRECADVDYSKANDWVKEHVLPNLLGATRARAYIAADILEFAGPDPEFWAYYASYDWVALCQLYGCMVDLPSHWPMYCRDFKQRLDEIGNPLLLTNTKPHNALHDAMWLKRNFEELAILRRYR